MLKPLLRISDDTLTNWLQTNVRAIRDITASKYKEFTIQLLDNIGTAQMTEEYLKRSRKLVLKNQQALEEEAGIRSARNENNLKEDLELIIEERQKTYDS